MGAERQWWIVDLVFSLKVHESHPFPRNMVLLHNDLIFSDFLQAFGLSVFIDVRPSSGKSILKTSGSSLQEDAFIAVMQ